MVRHRSQSLGQPAAHRRLDLPSREHPGRPRDRGTGHQLRRHPRAPGCRPVQRLPGRHRFGRNGFGGPDGPGRNRKQQRDGRQRGRPLRLHASDRQRQPLRHTDRCHGLVHRDPRTDGHARGRQPGHGHLLLRQHQRGEQRSHRLRVQHRHRDLAGSGGDDLVRHRRARRQRRLGVRPAGQPLPHRRFGDEQCPVRRQRRAAHDRRNVPEPHRLAPHDHHYDGGDQRRCVRA